MIKKTTFVSGKPCQATLEAALLLQAENHVETINSDVKQNNNNSDAELTALVSHMTQLAGDDNRIVNLLEACGIKRTEGEQRTWLLLYSLYTAVSMYDKMTETEQAAISAIQKKFRNFFGSRCTLKKRKTRKSERLVSPTPLSNEREKKEKVEENLSIVGRDAKAISEGEDGAGRTRKRKGRKLLRETLPFRRNAFLEECRKYGEPYDHGMVNSFYNYWAQENRPKTKMLFELQKTWNTAMRLAGWSKRSYQHDNEAAEIRLKRAKKKYEVDVASVEQQQAATERQKAAAAKREADNARLEQSIKESKEGAVSLEDYAREHPDSILAKQFLAAKATK